METIYRMPYLLTVNFMLLAVLAMKLSVLGEANNIFVPYGDQQPIEGASEHGTRLRE